MSIIIPNIPDNCYYDGTAIPTNTIQSMSPEPGPEPSINLQEKSETISTNTTTTITPDEGYDGLSSVSITTQVPTTSTIFNTLSLNWETTQSASRTLSFFTNFTKITGITTVSRGYVIIRVETYQVSIWIVGNSTFDIAHHSNLDFYYKDLNLASGTDIKYLMISNSDGHNNHTKIVAIYGFPTITSEDFDYTERAFSIDRELCVVPTP